MKSLLPLMILAVLWAGTGVLVGVGLNALYGKDWIMPCAALNIKIWIEFIAAGESQ